MKKISLYMMALLTLVFTACSEDYSVSTSPQSNPQESPLQSSDVTFTPAAITSINLADLITADEPIVLGTCTVTEGAMPANTTLRAKVDIARDASFSDAVTITAEDMSEPYSVNILPSTLQATYYNNFTHNPNQTTLYTRTVLYTITNGSSEAYIGTPGSNYVGNYTIQFTPVNEKDIYISTGYYAVVKQLDGSWAETKLKHAATDVYDDPVFTGSIEALKDESNVRQNTEYLIVAEEDLAAFKAGDASVAFGQGEGEGIVKGGPAFVGPALDGAAKYNLTLNMEKQTIVSEAEVHLYYYYIYGSGVMKPADTETYKNYMFYKTGANEFTYTTNWQSKRSLKIWEHEDYGKATNAWGVKASTFSETGALTKGAFWTLGNEGWYTLTITMDEDKDIHTYKWTPIAEPTATYTNISLIGTISGSNWDKDFELTQCVNAPHNWSLLDLELTADAELKFRADHDWTVNWGGDDSQPISKTVYTLPAGDKNIKVPAGKYNFYLNDITGDWSIITVEE